MRVIKISVLVSVLLISQSKYWINRMFFFRVILLHGHINEVHRLGPKISWIFKRKTTNEEMKPIYSSSAFVCTSSSISFPSNDSILCFSMYFLSSWSAANSTPTTHSLALFRFLLLVLLRIHRHTPTHRIHIRLYVGRKYKDNKSG